MPKMLSTSQKRLDVVEINSDSPARYWSTFLLAFVRGASAEGWLLVFDTRRLLGVADIKSLSARIRRVAYNCQVLDLHVNKGHDAC